MNHELNPDNPVKFIQVSAGMVFRNGLLLIAQRRTGDHLGGFWEFPGGKREPGETAEECLRRELREELEIEVAVHELVETVEHSYPDRAFCLKFFRCTWASGEPRAIGCQNFAWVTADQLADYQFPEADIQLLEKLRNSPGLWR
jgi:mutator protein MutT